MSIQLNGVFDPSYLETILRGFSVQIDRQNDQIAALTQELSGRPNSANFSAVEAQLESFSGNINIQMLLLDQRLQRIEQSVAEIQV